MKNSPFKLDFKKRLKFTGGNLTLLPLSFHASSYIIFPIKCTMSNNFNLQLIFLIPIAILCYYICQKFEDVTDSEGGSCRQRGKKAKGEIENKERKRREKKSNQEEEEMKRREVRGILIKTLKFQNL